MNGLRVKNTYDPDHFDPSGFNNADGSGGSATTIVQAKPGQKMQINLAMINNSVTAGIPQGGSQAGLIFELWNWMTSMLKVQNPNYINGNYTYIPLDSFEGIAAAPNYDGIVGFDKTGSVQIKGSHVGPEIAGTISCSTTPYRGFFESASMIPFMVNFIRMTFKTDAQYDNQVTWFQRTFAGKITSNNIAPRSFFKPNQFQPLTVDVTIGFPVGIDSGLSVAVNNGENVRYALFIDYWTRVNI